MRIFNVLSASALAVAFTVAPQAAHAERITLPDMPDNVKVKDGSKVYLVGHATGTQNYICLPSGTGFAYSLFTPEATLFNDHFKQLITHFFSVNPNPDDHGAIRATWQSSRDSSEVWAKAAPDGISTDERFVQRGAVAWVLLDTVGTQEGPSGGDTLSVATHVQRLNTVGGVAPSDCLVSTDVGKRAFMPYTADYFFYRMPDGDDDDNN